MNVPEALKLAGSMVPVPSTISPPRPFIVVTDWGVPYKVEVQLRSGEVANRRVERTRAVEKEDLSV